MAATSEDLKKLIAGGAGATAGPKDPIAAVAKENTPPAGGMMITPQPKAGLTANAMVQMSAVFDLLEQIQMTFGTETAEGQVVHQALGILTKKFGAQRQSHQSMNSAELRSMVNSTGGMAGGAAGKAVGAIPPTQPAIPPGGGGAPALPPMG